jgi:hypothetical protein
MTCGTGKPGHDSQKRTVRKRHSGLPGQDSNAGLTGKDFKRVIHEIFKLCFFFINRAHLGLIP